MEQTIQKSIIERFERFVENNKTWFDKLKYDNVVNIREVRGNGLSHAIDIKKPPFCVMYVAKVRLGTGIWYIFLDDYLDKIYNMFAGTPHGQE